MGEVQVPARRTHEEGVVRGPAAAELVVRRRKVPSVDVEDLRRDLDQVLDGSV